MGERLRILFVGRPNSIHVARWIGQLDGQGWELHLFPVSDGAPHSLLRNVRVHNRRRNELAGLLRFQFCLPLHMRGMTRIQRTMASLLRHGRGGSAGAPAGDATPWIVNSWIGRERRLARVIRRVRPHIVHSLMIPNSAYLTLEAKRLCGEPFPAWIVQNWGNDIYLFRHLPGHAERIRAVLAECDYYDCESERDVQLGLEFGFRGRVLPVLPNAGGYPLSELRAQRQPGPTSARRLILIKGYQSWQGRALFALRALRLAAPLLSSYRLAIFGAESEDVRVAARVLGSATGLDIQLLPPLSHGEMLRLHGQARVFISMNISDGIGISILEAMIMGAFPIQSDTSTAGEWITPGQSGLLVAPEDPAAIADAVRRAVSDDELVDRAAELNAQTADRRLDERVVRPQAVAIYREIADACGRGVAAGRPPNSADVR